MIMVLTLTFILILILSLILTLILCLPDIVLVIGPVVSGMPKQTLSVKSVMLTVSTPSLTVKVTVTPLIVSSTTVRLLTVISQNSLGPSSLSYCK